MHLLTDEIVRMTTFTGTPHELADTVRLLVQFGMTNLSLHPPPRHTRELVLEVEKEIMPLLERVSV